ncbi:hypothetical protein ACFTAO_28655 [Paenibacillus rhizoplanae]
MGDLVGETIYEEKHSVLMLLFTLAVWTVLSILFEKGYPAYPQAAQAAGRGAGDSDPGR